MFSAAHSHPNPSRFRLFARFAIFGLIGFFLIAFLLFRVWMSTVERRLLDETKSNTAKSVNALVSHMLTEKDFRGIKRGRDWELFREKIADLFSLPEVVRVKIYNSAGDLIWTDVKELLALSPEPSKNPELLEALEGHIKAEVSELKKDEHRFERAAFRRLMELYIPIYLGQSKPAGVAEVYLNVDPLFATLRDTGWLIGLTVVGGLGLLLTVSFFGLGRAVGLIHKQNQDLRERLEEIFRATRLKNELLANLSSEIRSPEAIMGYANLLLDGGLAELPAKGKKGGPSVEEKIRNAAAELLAHFARIIELSRLKIGDIRPERESVELTGLLRDITSDLRLLCVDGVVTLELDVPPEKVVINSDRGLVQQVILNLVTNALKFTPQGRVQVRLEKDPEREDVRIIVEDTGIGIKPEELARVFEEFYRGNHPDARFKSGVGLGLPIVKRSLELIGGRIGVESAYGQGSKFIVTLPKELPEGARARETHIGKAGGGASRTQPSSS